MIRLIATIAGLAPPRCPQQTCEPCLTRHVGVGDGSNNTQAQLAAFSYNRTLRTDRQIINSHQFSNFCKHMFIMHSVLKSITSLSSILYSISLVDSPFLTMSSIAYMSGPPVWVSRGGGGSGVVLPSIVTASLLTS